jgi:hypothetical protein
MLRLQKTKLVRDKLISLAFFQGGDGGRNWPHVLGRGFDKLSHLQHGTVSLISGCFDPDNKGNASDQMCHMISFQPPLPSDTSDDWI